MTISQILLEIDGEIAKLRQAKAMLSGLSSTRGPGRPAAKPASSAATSFNPEEFGGVTKKRRKMSQETRNKMAEAQRLRWANSRKAGS